MLMRSITLNIKSPKSHSSDWCPVSQTLNNVHPSCWRTGADMPVDLHSLDSQANMCKYFLCKLCIFCLCFFPDSNNACHSKLQTFFINLLWSLGCQWINKSCGVIYRASFRQLQYFSNRLALSHFSAQGPLFSSAVFSYSLRVIRLDCTQQKFPH